MIAYQNFKGASMEVLRLIFIILNVYIEKEQISKPMI